LFKHPQADNGLAWGEGGKRSAVNAQKKKKKKKKKGGKKGRHPFASDIRFHTLRGEEKIKGRERKGNRSGLAGEKGAKRKGGEGHSSGFRWKTRI